MWRLLERCRKLLMPVPKIWPISGWQGRSMTETSRSSITCAGLVLPSLRIWQTRVIWRLYRRREIPSKVREIYSGVFYGCLQSVRQLCHQTHTKCIGRTARCISKWTEIETMSLYLSMCMASAELLFGKGRWPIMRKSGCPRDSMWYGQEKRPVKFHCKRNIVL